MSVPSWIPTYQNTSRIVAQVEIEDQHTNKENAKTFSERLRDWRLRMADVASQITRTQSQYGQAVWFAFHTNAPSGEPDLEQIQAAVNEAVQTAIQQTLGEAESLLQVAREARAEADGMGDSNPVDKEAAEATAAQAEAWADKARDIIIALADRGHGLQFDDATLQRLTALWKGDPPPSLVQTLGLPPPASTSSGTGIRTVLPTGTGELQAMRHPTAPVLEPPKLELARQLYEAMQQGKVPLPLQRAVASVVHAFSHADQLEATQPLVAQQLRDFWMPQLQSLAHQLGIGSP